jgi:hypothetical protein
MGSASTTRIVASVAPSERSPAQVASEFRRLLRDGAKLRVAGEARRRPLQLLSRGYTPKYKIELFDTCFYLTDVRQDAYIRYFVAYVVPGGPRGRRREIHARVFYKDVSLQWRAASHFVRSDGENWIGKGDVRRVVAGGYETLTSAEETTDLPLEMQSALEVLIRRVRKVRTDARGVALVLRRAPKDRIEAYRDFTAPRRRAQADRRNWINGGRSIARFTRKHDPTSRRASSSTRARIVGSTAARSIVFASSPGTARSSTCSCWRRGTPGSSRRRRRPVSSRAMACARSTSSPTKICSCPATSITTSTTTRIRRCS